MQRAGVPSRRRLERGLRRPIRVGLVAFAPALLLSLSLLAGCAGTPHPAAVPEALALKGSLLDVHDPSGIVKEGNTYYLFSTGTTIPIHCSNDFLSWRQCGNVMTTMPGSAAVDVPGADGPWAPDISFFNGKYHLYYAISTFGSNRSDIGLATNVTLDQASPSYSWVDEGKVLGSTSTDDWNAIDPNLILDADGRPGLPSGASGAESSSSRSIRNRANLLRARASAARLGPEQPGAIEAAFIVHRGGYYYLFASYDFCCRGSDSTYNIRVGRSAEITGPYADRAGDSHAARRRELRRGRIGEMARAGRAIGIRGFLREVVADLSLL